VDPHTSGSSKQVSITTTSGHVDNTAEKKIEPSLFSASEYQMCNIQKVTMNVDNAVYVETASNHNLVDGDVVTIVSSVDATDFIPYPLQAGTTYKVTSAGTQVLALMSTGGALQLIADNAGPDGDFSATADNTKGAKTLQGSDLAGGEQWSFWIKKCLPFQVEMTNILTTTETSGDSDTWITTGSTIGAVGDAVVLESTGTLPGGLAPGLYYIQCNTRTDCGDTTSPDFVDANTISLSLTNGGGAVAITNLGTNSANQNIGTVHPADFSAWGGMTQCLNWDASAQAVQEALDAVKVWAGDESPGGNTWVPLKPGNPGATDSDYGVQVTRTGLGDSTSSYGYTWSITFSGSYVRGNVPAIKVYSSIDTSFCNNAVPADASAVVADSRSGATAVKELTLTSATTSTSSNKVGFIGDSTGLTTANLVAQTFKVQKPGREVQQIVVKNDQTITGGTYVLTFNNEDTVAIPYDAADVFVENALNALSTTGGVSSPDGVGGKDFAGASGVACSEFIKTATTETAADLLYMPATNGLATDVCERHIHVTRHTDPILAPNGFVYYVYFEGSSVSGDVNALTVKSETNFNIATPVAVTVYKNLEGFTAGVFSESQLPLALTSDYATGSGYLGGPTDASKLSNLNIYKVNGHLWTVKLDTYLGDLPKLTVGTSKFAGTDSAITVTDDFLQGDLPTSYTIPNLKTGIQYNMRVSAENSMGYGPTSTTLVTGTPMGVAEALSTVESGHALHVDEIQTVTTAATHIDEVQTVTTSAKAVPEVQMVKTEWLNPPGEGYTIDGKLAVRFPEVHTITVSAGGTITSGTFKLSFTRVVSAATNSYPTTALPRGNNLVEISGTTSALNWDASAQTVEDELNGLDSICGAGSDCANTGARQVHVTRTGDGTKTSNFGYTFSVSFVGTFVAGANHRLPSQANDKDNVIAASEITLTVNGGLTSSVTTDVINVGKALGTDTEIQTVTVSAAKPVTVGAYTLSFTNRGSALTTACIPWNSLASTVEAEIEALANVDSVRVEREGDATETSCGGNCKYGYKYTVFFDGNAVRGDVATLTATEDDGCGSFRATENNVLVSATGSVVPALQDEGGFNSDNTVYSSSMLADRLKADLEQLPTVEVVEISRSIADRQGGYAWHIVFPVTTDDANVDSLVCGFEPTTGYTSPTDITCSGVTVTDGNVLGSTFILSGSEPIAYNADENDVKTALEATENIGVVSVSRSAANSQRGYTWSITFITDIGDVDMLQATSSLTGTDADIVVEEVTKGNMLAGTFTLTYSAETTVAIAYNAEATTVKNVLEDLNSLGRVDVVRTGPDTERGYQWTITFRDTSNDGDVANLISNPAGLTGEGKVVHVREMTKGASATGNQLWLSFVPPASRNGAAITKYQVQWDTAATFTTSSMMTYDITDASLLYEEQKITTSADSLTTSTVRGPVSGALVYETQTILIVGDPADVFTLTFRGATTTDITLGTTKYEDIPTLLGSLGTVTAGSVSVTVADNLGAEVLATNVITKDDIATIKFTAELGDLPIMSVTGTAAQVSAGTNGKTPYRKEIQTFTCTEGASAGSFTVTFAGQTTATIADSATIPTLKTELEKLSTIPSPNGVTVYDTAGGTTGSVCSTTGTKIYVRFDRLHGDVDAMSFTATTLSISDVGVDAVTGITVATGLMSGSFQVSYNSEATGVLNAGADAIGMRDALEALPSINTADVTRDYSKKAITGSSLSITKGAQYAECGGGACNFLGAGYGVPGDLISIGSEWYRIYAADEAAALSSSKLYIADLANNPTGYKGETVSGITAYEWAKGYEWTVVFQLTTVAPQSLFAPVDSLYPADSSIRLSGRTCSKCYYLPSGTNGKLTMGVPYHVQVFAHNAMGASAASNALSAVPKQIPGAPTAVSSAVVSGTELEVFFSPPALPSDSVAAGYSDDITRYIVQWDTDQTFSHGTNKCAACATKLNALGGTTVTVAEDLTSVLSIGDQIMVGSCQVGTKVMTVTGTSWGGTTGTVSVTAGHTCEMFSTSATAGNAIRVYRATPDNVEGLAIQGTPPFKHIINDLTASTKYYIRVAAVNSVDVQAVDPSGTPPDNTNWAGPFYNTPKDAVPNSPGSVVLSVRSGTSLMVTVKEPTRTGGQAISHYKIEYATTADFAVNLCVSASCEPAAPAAADMLDGSAVFYLDGLTAGTNYYVRVSAKNAVGYGSPTSASGPLSPVRAPDSPSRSDLTTVSVQDSPITHLTVGWTAPSVTGGSPITKYRVEWWAIERDEKPMRVKEVQVVTIKWAAADAATVAAANCGFKLSFGGEQTNTIAKDASAVNMRNELMNMGQATSLVIGDVSVTRTAINTNEGYRWSITFNDDGLNNGDVPELECTNCAISWPGGVDHTISIVQEVGGQRASTFDVSGSREVQTLTTAKAAGEVKGFFRVKFKSSEYTNYLPIDVSADEFENALEGLTTLSMVTVTSEACCTDGVGAVAQGYTGHAWAITFDTNVGDQEKLFIDTQYLTENTGTPSGNALVVSDGDNQPGVCRLGSSDQISTACVIGETPVEYGSYETSDASVLTYQIPNLNPGTAYAVSVSAKNARGYGPRAPTSPQTLIPPKQRPGKPTGVGVGVEYGDSQRLKVTYSPPLSDGGDPVVKYRAELDTSDSFNNPFSEEFTCSNSPTRATWVVTTSVAAGSITDGYFALTLTRNGLVHTTEAIAWDAVDQASREVGGAAVAGGSTVMCQDSDWVVDCAAGRIQQSGSVQSKLEALDVIGSVDVSRSAQNADGGYAWTITFNDDGNDFVFEASSTQGTLTTSTATQGIVSSVLVQEGATFISCTGTRAMPTNGGLTKGQLYYVRVFAYNSIGYSDPQISPNPQKPMVIPGAPTGVTLEVVSKYQLKVVFSPPDDDGGDTVTKYLIEWDSDIDFSTDPQSAEVTELSGGAPYFYTIGTLDNPLTTGTYYFIRVKAGNSQGYGPTVRSSPNSLNPSETPSAPTSVLLGSTSPSMVTITWDLPTSNGGDPIVGYRVMWDKSPTFNSLELAPHKGQVIVAATERAYTVELLSEGIVYYSQVAAINGHGTGTDQKATPQYAKPLLNPPGKPVSLVASTGNTAEIVVSWQRPRVPHHGYPCFGTATNPADCPPHAGGGDPMSDGGAVISKYKIQFSQDPQFAVSNTGEVVVTSGTAYTLSGTDGVAKGVEYYVRVLAYNSMGFGDPCMSSGALCDGAVVKQTAGA
jgi:hypothetical protein